jgi:NADPH-dependent ferric siderophore reductase
MGNARESILRGSLMETPNDSGAKPPRRRPPIRSVTVRRVARLTPRVVQVTFAGEELASFGPPRPGGHIKVFFPEPGWQRPPPGAESEAPRPPSRTYTPRRWDAATTELDVEFVLHGEGIASRWAEHAKPGWPLYVAGPGGGFELPAEAQHLVLLADDTAMPAAATILESLPASCRATVVCAVSDAGEERPFARTAHPTRWLHFGTRPDRAGTELERAVPGLADAYGSAYWWIACEAAAMRRMRRHLLAERRLDAARVHTRGYWKLGETNYPDHDYGRDG